MIDKSALQKKVIEAFKGIVTTYRLEEAIVDPDSIGPQFRASWEYFTNQDDKNFELYYEIKSVSRVLDLLERLYPGQVDKKLAKRFIMDALREWITEGKDSANKDQLESVGMDFIKKIESAIKPTLVFLPIEGLAFNSPESLHVGNCELHKNHANSTFVQTLQQHKKRYSKAETIPENEWEERIKSYFTCKNIAHPERAMEQGIEEANLALNILRLYMSSYYFHENNRQVVKRMGLYGSLHLHEQSRIFYISPDEPIGEQYPGTREARVLQNPFEINHDFVKYMLANGLDQINQHVQPSQLENNDISRRLLRAVTWFAKATSAKNIADSYLMYAIG